jgi:hypothetical protein
MPWRLFAAIVVTLQVSCAGNVVTTALPPDALKEGRTIDGVVFYPPQYMKLTYAFTARTDEKGKLLGTAEDKKCVPIVQKEEVSIMPDLSHPLALRNSSGAFSAAKFAVTLSNGMLASVNSEPTQKLSDILTASAALLKEVPGLGVATLVPPTSIEACNASPRLVGFAKQSF